MKRILIPVAALLLVACNRPTQPEETAAATVSDTAAMIVEPQATSDSATQVDAVTSATAMPNHSSFNGTLVIPPQRHATVTLTMGGTIHSTSLLPGEYVKKGTVLVTLENPDFIDLQQTYLDAHAQAEYLLKEYERQERLSAEEAASQKRFQQSKADYLSMKSRLEAAAAQLTILGIDPDELLRNGIRPYLEVKSPLNGYVASMNLNLGKYIEAGQPVCDVIDKGETLLCLTAYEKDLQDLEPGKRVQFRVNGMGEQTFHATLLSVGQEVDETSRSLEVYARVKESNARFRPGMYVSAHVEK
ncbi:efflux RND transporter periplasmic adaptor subunit [Parabacteroides sp. ASD2025]|uniref:efflux RND transporter periplasmic adaptor subunit n=1 Tax=Parabacteroides sp. ASD2025 TaxID=3415987 RepID=UPI003CE70784